MIPVHGSALRVNRVALLPVRSEEPSEEDSRNENRKSSDDDITLLRCTDTGV